jgi:hypothetical protein
VPAYNAVEQAPPSYGVVPVDQGPILRNTISAEDFSDEFSSSIFGPIPPQKQPLSIYQSFMDKNLGF